MRDNIKKSLVVVLLLAAVFLCAGAAVPARAGEHVAVADTPREGQRVLPVLMYHQLMKFSKGEYIVNPQMFEEDLIELKLRGYETVLPSEVIAFAGGTGSLPAKPIMVTFDDGHYNNVFYGQEALERQGCRAVLNIIGKYSDISTTSGDHSQPAYSHLTWPQIADAAAGGVFEIGNHTFDMHSNRPRKGVSRRKGESEEQYKKVLTEDVGKLQHHLSKFCGITPVCFAYPFGLYNSLSERVLSDMGFDMIFTCYEQRNMITSGKPDCIKRVCRFNRCPKYGSAKFFDKLERSKVMEYSM